MDHTDFPSTAPRAGWALRWLRAVRRGAQAAAGRAATSAVALALALAPAVARAADDDARTQALRRASDAVIGVEVRAVDGARSADTLGAARRGSGVVIGDDGLVLTIGYLILEADRIDLVLDDLKRVPARVMAYDMATGFGLVQPLVPLALAPVPLGRADAVGADEPLLFASGGTGGAVSVARLQSRRNFAGYWEYFIEGALFTSPARPDHSGAGLFNRDGELVGIGSLIVNDAAGTGERSPGNMFVPVDLLKPIFTELRTAGRSSASTRAWLGLNCAEDDGHLRVIRVAQGGPAEAAGIGRGDEIVSIDGVAVRTLESLWQTLWSGGATERDVRLEVLRGGAKRVVTVRSTDRMSTLQRARGI